MDALENRLDRLDAAVRRVGGVARAATMRREGHTAHVIARGVDAGRLVRVRRDWIALPDADRECVAAAREGVVLSCVTQARRLGLWVLHEDRAHVAANPGSTGGKSRHFHVHWGRPFVPRHPDALVDRIENVLQLVATCRPFEEALIVWESAMRRDMVDRRLLERLAISGATRRLLESAHPFSDSGLETPLAPRLRWLRVRIVPQARILGHRVDFLLGERLILQVDGGHHVGFQRASDIAHDAELALRGYTVVRVSYAQVVDDWPAVQDRLARAVALGLHRAS